MRSSFEIPKWEFLSCIFLQLFQINSVEPEEGFDSFKASDGRGSKDDVSRNNEGHHRAGARRTIESELASDAVGSFSHSTKTEMSFPAFCQNVRFHADPIVTHTQSKILRVGQYNL